MIASISRGASFRGLLAYVLDPKHQPVLVGTNMGGRDVPELAREFGTSLRDRRASGARDAIRPVVHVSLSFAREDRRLSQAELSLIVEEFSQRLGYDGCQYVAVEHNDRQHQHLHIVLSRVRPDGSLVRHELRDYQKAMAVCRDLEREHGLRQLLPELGLHQATRDEYRDALRTGQPSERRRLQALVLAAMTGRPRLSEFVGRLEGQAVEVRLRRADDGPVLGISYKLGRFAFRGSALGASLTWRGLLAQGLDYDHARDRAVVERLSRREGPSLIPTLGYIEDRARQVIDRALATRPTLPQFMAELEAAGVAVHLNRAQTGYISGISYGVEGRVVKGSTLGREYSWHPSSAAACATSRSRT